MKKHISKFNDFITESNKTLKEYLDSFPDDTQSWADATDEIRDIARTAKEYYNELNKDGEVLKPLNFKSITKPSEWNKQGKKYIMDVYSKMDKYTKEQFDDYLKNNFNINESKFDNLEKEFKLKKVDSLNRAYDAVNKNIITEDDLRNLEYIYKLIENGEIKKAQVEKSKLDSLVSGFAPDIPRNKVTGSVVVEFEMSSEFLDKDELIEYIKEKLEDHLTEEWQTSRCFPDMDTFKIN